MQMFTASSNRSYCILCIVKVIIVTIFTVCTAEASVGHAATIITADSVYVGFGVFGL